MEVIAKTNGAFLIQATESEIKEIVNSVTGTKPKEIEIGQKIPAIDYASTITKIKNLKENHYYQQLLNYKRNLYSAMSEFEKSVNDAALIEV